MARRVAETGSHPVDRHVGWRIRDRRIRLGYSQTDLSRALGVTFQQVQKYEKATNRISSSKLWDAADFFKVEVAYFFEGLGPDAGSPPEWGRVDEDAPTTRECAEIIRRAPRLSITQQKLALELIRDMASRTNAQAGDPGSQPS